MPPKKGQSVDARLPQVASYIAKYVPLGDIAVDFYGVAGLRTSSGRDATIAGLEALAARGRSVIPAYGFQRDATIWNDLARLVRHFNRGFCFRIDRDDLDDQAEDTWAELLERRGSMGVTPLQTDLVIDLRSISSSDIPNCRELVLDFLHMGPDIGTYRTVAIVGSSALKTVTGIDEDGEIDIARNELALWSELELDLPDSLSVSFGDYGVVHPDFSDRGSAKNMNGKVRYTLGSTIRYFRGRRLHGDYEQYHELARRVRSSGLYLGRDFSLGDKYVDDVAEERVKPGSPGTWVLADMNHHMSYAHRQMTHLVKAIRQVEDRASAMRLLAAAV